MFARCFVSLVALSLAPSVFAAPLPCAGDTDDPREAALLCLDDDDYSREALNLLAWTGTEADVERILPFLEESSWAISALVGIGGPAARQAILDTAANPRSYSWESAVQALGALGGDDALALLTQYAADPDVGGYASDGLARLGTPAALAAVTELFRSANAEMPAYWYADSLRKFPKDSGAADVLWDSIAKKQWPQSEEALHMLAKMQDPRVMKAVEQRLASPYEDVRASAFEALTEMPADKGLPLLREHLAKGDAEDAEDVAETMLSLDPSTRAELVQFVKDGPEDHADGVAEAIWPFVGAHDVTEALAMAKARPGKIADRLRENLFIQTWNVGAVPDAVLDEARKELDRPAEKVDSRVLSVLLRGAVSADRSRLVQLAESGPTPWRVLAIDALAEQPGKATDDLLLGWVFDGNSDVADAAISAFDSRSPEARDRLAAALVATPAVHASSWSPREDRLAYGGKAGRDVLVEQIRNGTGTERDAAISALVDTERRADLDQLMKLAPDLDADGRERVLVAVLDSERAPLALVVELLDDADDDLATSAIEALVEAEPPDALDRLDKIVRAKKRSDDVREAALEGVADLAPADLEARLERYIDKAPLSETALTELVELGSKKALETVMNVARTHADPETRVAALDAFWTNTGGPVTDLFIELLDDPADDVRASALSALGRVGSTRAAKVAEARLKSDDKTKAVEAAEVLLDLGGAPAARNDARIRKLAKEEPALQWRLD